jgi:hypothetical protein
VSVEGLEPSTNGLKGHCSAIELHARGANVILSCLGAGVNDYTQQHDSRIPLTFNSILVTMG